MIHCPVTVRLTPESCRIRGGWVRGAILAAQLLWTAPLCSAEIDEDASRHSIEALAVYLGTLGDAPVASDDLSNADIPLTMEDEQTARGLLRQHIQARLKQERAAEMEAREIQSGELTMPFAYRVFGEAGGDGRRLFISMHGGGGAPARVNDQQWENQKGLYEPEEGVYLAPRAPTDAWNLWHQPHIDEMFQRLIENLIVFEGVDPNRVYLMGYSAGGDGVYQLAPRMADRFAAAAMMAGHPNEARPLGLRNIPFTIHVGGLDSAYNRNQVAEEWGRKLDALQEADPDGYRHLVTVYPKKGHWMDREDASAVPWMAEFTRNPVPRRVVWWQDNVTHDAFYWLAVNDEQRQSGVLVEANVEGQIVNVTGDGLDALIVLLDDRLLDLNQPIRIQSGEQVLFDGTLPRTLGNLVRTLQQRGDAELMFSASQTVQLP